MGQIQGVQDPLRKCLVNEIPCKAQILSNNSKYNLWYYQPTQCSIQCTKKYIKLARVRILRYKGLLRYLTRFINSSFLYQDEMKGNKVLDLLFGFNKTCDKHDKNMMQISMNKRTLLRESRLKYCILQTF